VTISEPAALDGRMLAEWLRHLDEERAQVIELFDRSEALRAALEDIDVETLDVTWVAEETEESDLVLRHVRGGRTDLLRGLVVPAGLGLTGKVPDSMRPGWVNDYFKAVTITHTFDREIRAEGLKRLLAVPIAREGSIFGVLAVGCRAVGTFGSRAIDHARSAADRTALAVAMAERVRLDREIAIHEERRRMAAELHDGVGALLFAIGSGVAGLAEQSAGDPELEARLRRLQAQASEASAALRDSLRTLRASPAALELGVTLRADCAAFCERTGIAAELVILEEPRALPTSRSDVLVGAVREALLNVEKHSQARAVVVTVASRVVAGRDTLVVAVTDDGVGLPAQHRFGLGLTSTQEAVARIGGALRLTTDASGGTSWRVQIPC